MGSFADFQAPASSPYVQTPSWNIVGWDVSFIGERYFDSTIVNSTTAWSPSKELYIQSGGTWKKVEETNVIKDGSWRSSSSSIENTNRVQRVQMWAYVGTLPSPSNICGNLSWIYNTDDGGFTLNFPFPYTVPTGYRLTKFGTAWAADDGVGYIRFVSNPNGEVNNNTDFYLASFSSAGLLSDSTADISPQQNVGCNSVHIHTKNWVTWDSNCIGCTLKDRKLGHRFPNSLNAAYPIMTHDQNSLRFSKSSASNCSNCESRLRYVYMEFHSGNAITLDGGETWTAPS